MSEEFKTFFDYAEKLRNKYLITLSFFEIV